MNKREGEGMRGTNRNDRGGGETSQQGKHADGNKDGKITELPPIVRNREEKESPFSLMTDSTHSSPDYSRIHFFSFFFFSDV